MVAESASAVTIKDVWANNLEEEFAKIRDIITKYPYIAMDTEFPGVVVTPVGVFRSHEDFNYQQVCVNVNVLKLIQVGFAFFDSDGRQPEQSAVWQFNFKFNLLEDMYSSESVEFLRIAGIDFNRHLTEGIRMEDFGELLTTSGLVVDHSITWISFHSGYDFGYLMRTMLLSELPPDETLFFKLHHAFFPSSFDLKILTHPSAPDKAPSLGLQAVAEKLSIKRTGPRHQAGSDSLLTGRIFFQLKERIFGSNWPSVARSIRGELFGLRSSIQSSSLSCSAAEHPLFSSSSDTQSQSENSHEWMAAHGKAQSVALEDVHLPSASL